MSEAEAKGIAAALAYAGAEAVHTGGNEWTVEIHRRGGGLVVISESGVAEYANRGRYDDGDHDAAIDWR